MINVSLCRYLWEVVRAIMEGARNPLQDAHSAEAVGLQALQLLLACTHRLGACVSVKGGKNVVVPKQGQAVVAAMEQQQRQQRSLQGSVSLVQGLEQQGKQLSLQGQGSVQEQHLNGEGVSQAGQRQQQTGEKEVLQGAEVQTDNGALNGADEAAAKLLGE